MSATSFVKNPEREDIAHENARVRMEIMRLRSAKTPTKEDELAPFKWSREKYDIVPIGPGHPTAWTFPLDPNRRVAPYWKKLMIDKAGGYVLLDGQPETFEIMEGGDGPLRVRWLQGNKAGAVEELPVLEYIAARAAGCNQKGNPKVEPVPDNEPLCPPARPSPMPSSMRKARAMTAESLKKNPEELSFDEVVSHFSTLLNKTPENLFFS